MHGCGKPVLEALGMFAEGELAALGVLGVILVAQVLDAVPSDESSSFADLVPANHVQDRLRLDLLQF